jgi:predicted dehydrogenase
MRSLAAGKHVLCEKPYSRYPAEVEEAFAYADTRGLILTEGFLFRHHAQTRVASRLVV